MFELGLPSTGANTVYGYQLQGVKVLGDWTSTVQSVLARIMQEIRIRVDWGPEKRP